MCVDLFQRFRCIERVLRQIAVDRDLRQILIIQRRAVGELCELPHGSAYAVLVVSLRAPVYPAAYGSLGQQQLRLGIGADERRARRGGIGITVYRGITTPVRAAVILVLELGIFVSYEPRAIGAVGETARQAFLDGRIGIAILEVATRLHRDGRILAHRTDAPFKAACASFNSFSATYRCGGKEYSDVYVRVPDTGSMYPMDDTDS